MSKSAMSDKDAIPFKVVMLGDSSVGKTCLVKRFIDNSFDSMTKATIGQDFKSKSMKVSSQGVEQTIRLQIWDTAGSEEYKSLTQMYYKNANAFCLVYDSTNKATFDALTYWTEQIAEKMDTKYSLFIVASKIDLNQ